MSLNDLVEGGAALGEEEQGKQEEEEEDGKVAAEPESGEQGAGLPPSAKLQAVLDHVKAITSKTKDEGNKVRQSATQWLTASTHH